MPSRLLVVVLLIGMGAVSATGILSWRALNSPMEIPSNGARLDIPQGTPLAGVTDELARRAILNTPRLLTFYARLSGDATRIHAGEYQIAPETSPRQLLRQLVDGDVVLHTLTVVEGRRFDEFLTALREHPAIIPSNDSADVIMRKLGADGVHPEGQFYPDTYSFPRGTTDLEVLRQAHQALNDALTTAWEQRQTGALKNAYEALVLASIIEKETALSSERRRIAGVFSRRLQRGMRLQTDPTVIYGLGDRFDGNLRRIGIEVLQHLHASGTSTDANRAPRWRGSPCRSRTRQWGDTIFCRNRRPRWQSLLLQEPGRAQPGGDSLLATTA